jgi:hypothetical protein
MSSNQQQNKAAADKAAADKAAADKAAADAARIADEPFEVIAESKTHRVCQSATRAWKEEKPAKPERAA